MIVLQLEKCIMSHFKIDLNVSVICKSIKIQNRNTHKKKLKYPRIRTKTPIKRNNKNIQKGDNENPKKGIIKTNQKTQNLSNKMKKKTKRKGCHQRRKMAALINNTHTREDISGVLLKHPQMMWKYIIKWYYKTYILTVYSVYHYQGYN